MMKKKLLVLICILTSLSIYAEEKYKEKLKGLRYVYTDSGCYRINYDTKKIFTYTESSCPKHLMPKVPIFSKYIIVETMQFYIGPDLPGECDECDTIRINAAYAEAKRKATVELRLQYNNFDTKDITCVKYYNGNRILQCHVYIPQP